MQKTRKEVEDAVDRDRNVFWSPAEGDTTKTLELYENTLVIPTSAGSAGTVYLPKVAEAEGLSYSVRLKTYDTNAITVADQDDSIDWTDQTLDANADNLMVQSNGSKWLVLVDDEN